MEAKEMGDFSGQFEFLEHTADAFVAAYGKTMEEAFGNAALAMFEVMTDTKRVVAEQRVEVVVEAQDEYALIYNWLEKLLVEAEVEGLLFSKFKVHSIQQTKKGFRVEASVWGEAFDPQRHTQKVGVKAVTYHQMEISKEEGKVKLVFLLDI
ncbi:MAG: archease [Candidatus Bathyarchaeota archaeon]|nr:archease [Candidatus Bathyarchaeota archaeon]